MATSSADTGSSHTTSSGRAASARAGADALHFPPVPHGRPPLLSVTCGGPEGSRIDLPLRAVADGPA